MKTMIWAHRGASAAAPENSMEAFKLAYEMGADGIELDVHLTRDGRLVVAHDETIDRCSDGMGRIADKNLSELQEYDFSCGKPGFSNTRIPVFEQVLEWIRDTHLLLNVEIKSGIVFYEGIEEKLVNTVKAMKMESRVLYSSFNHYSLMQVRKADPGAGIGLLYSEVMIDPHLYALHLKADAIHPHFLTLMVPGVIEDCHHHGIEINAWTVDRPDYITWLCRAGIHAVITNVPDVALKTRNAL